uniref:Uncharacterized protein n=1 Tax=Timspurckia oligopyrenoides TaxID=708627 RepID=A0A7S0ZFG5_9RHOD|mmetsp:Transcript_3197/g.5622  ORF Transcript_3197/g.5622 Transcript_3197/m.5622 type:complete len:131 (+) Transcript_3197:98-490(+)
MAFESVVELCEGRLAAFTIAPGFADRSREDRVAAGFSSFDDLESVVSFESERESCERACGIRGESGFLPTRTHSSVGSEGSSSGEWTEAFESSANKKSMTLKLKEINSRRSGGPRKSVGGMLKKVMSRWH